MKRQQLLDGQRSIDNTIKKSKQNNEKQQEDKTESSQKSFSPIQSVHESNAQESTREFRINTQANVPSIMVKIDLDKLNNNKNEKKSWRGETSTDEIDWKTKLDLNCSKRYTSLEKIQSTKECTEDSNEENVQCSLGTSDYMMYSDEKLLIDNDEKQMDKEEIETLRRYDKNAFLGDKVKEYEENIKRIKETIIPIQATRLQKKCIRIKESFRTYFGNHSDASESEEDMQIGRAHV